MFYDIIKRHKLQIIIKQFVHSVCIFYFYFLCDIYALIIIKEKKNIIIIIDSLQKKITFKREIFNYYSI